MLVYAPSVFGFSTGIGTDNGLDPTHGGCTACHGGEAFATQGAPIHVTFTDADGTILTGPYLHDAVYTVKVSVNELNAPDGGEAGQHAGFNFYSDTGNLEALDDQVQIMAGGSEATHTNPDNTEWTFQWTAPADGVATFRLYLNDVDGSGAADAGDQVYLEIFSLTDDHYAMPGAVEEHEVHYGVSLPQYWLGLIALAMMVVIIIFGFVYLKYVSPHNTDQKDR